MVPRKRQARAVPAQKVITASRMRILTAVFLVAALVLVGRLAWVQLKWGPQLQTVAAEQRERDFEDPARRGAILDREGNYLAYTMKARSLTVSPVTLRRELGEIARNEMYENGATRAEAEAQQDARVEDILRQMANEIPTMISDDQVQDPNGESSEESDDKDEKDDDKKSSGEKDKLPTPQVKSKDILEKLHADTDYEVLVRNVDPDVAAKVAEKFHGVAADRQDIRAVSYTHLTLPTNREV